ncbi:MAG: PEP-utilizing enzyme [Patescibacteria group bacterium]|nr:PEP-utilizing enzyme [Patescibacteria group bacterium]MDD5295203.1 PEP-utilizing enzyme [Patescibacteria group bacterium]MDD5554311.1 PEP-utilizing enzyme [Patescibacteria group bacterium]
MVKKRKNKKQTVWFVAERIPDVNYIMTYNIFIGYGKRFKEQGLGDYLKQLLWVIKDGVFNLCYAREEFDGLVKRIFAKATNDLAWLAKINKEVEIFAREYLVFSKSLLKLDLKRLSNRQLIEKFNQLLEFQIRSHSYAQATTWLIDADYQLFSNYLFNYLKEKIRQNKLKFELSSVFSTITTPLSPSFVEIENQESLKIAYEIFKDKGTCLIFKKNDNVSKIEAELKKQKPALLKKLKNHQKKWFWLHHSYRGPVLELDYFLQVWQGLIKEGKIRQYLKESKTKYEKLKKEQKNLLKKLKFDVKHEELFRQARYIVWLKAYRKDCMYFGAYVANQFVKEIARRLFISYKQAEFMTREEFGRALLAGKYSTKELDERPKFSVMHGTWNKVYVYSGKKAYDFLKKTKWEKEKIKKVDELTGQTASPGKARGVVKIIETIEDMPKMESGDIMLSETTYPALVPAMKKAAAIVTNVGGLTCHAAIVARELKIPCVVGTKIATKVLKDGDKVEVDASKGVVKILK